MAHIQDCMVGAETLPIQLLWQPQWCTHLSEAWCFYGGATYMIFFVCVTNLTKANIQASYCSVISLLSSQVRSCKKNTFLIPEECNHDFSCWWHTLQFLLPLGIFCVIPLIFTWIRVQNGRPRSWDNLQQQAFTSYIILVQKISLCFSSCICQISWHPSSREIEIVKLFSNCNYTAFASVYCVE